MARRRVEVTREQLEWALSQTNSARAASTVLGVAFMTFKRRCVEFGLYKPNQGLKGTSKPNPRAEIPLERIFSNEHFMNSKGLKQKLLKAGMLANECAACELPPVWNGRKLTLQLDHIDGDRTNNERSNLRLLCPNCHSQTDTFSKGKFRKKPHADMLELVDRPD